MKYIIRTLLLACCCMQAQAQAPWKPDTELEQSNHVHRIMKANPAHAGLTRWEKKEVLKSRVLPLAEDFGALRHTGDYPSPRPERLAGIQPLFRLGICGCTGRLSDLCRIHPIQ